MRPGVCRRAVLVHRIACSLERGPARCQACAQQTRQHVARTGGGQEAVAGGVDVRRQAWRGDHGAAALQHHHRCQAGGQRLRCGEAVALHLGRGGAQQPRGFQRVRRQHGGQAAFGPSAHARGQIGPMGNGVERVGIQHQAWRLRQDGGQQRGHRGAAAAATHRRQAGPRQRLRVAEHQLGLRHIAVELRLAQQAHVHAPRAAVQCGAGGQQGRARHRGGGGVRFARFGQGRRGGAQRFTADDGDVAAAALVAGVRIVRHGGRAGQAGRRRRIRQRHVQVVEPDGAAGVARVGGEQACLEGEQAQRVDAAFGAKKASCAAGICA